MLLNQKIFEYVTKHTIDKCKGKKLQIGMKQRIYAEFGQPQKVQGIGKRVMLFSFKQNTILWVYIL